MKYTIKRNKKDIATVSPTGSLICKIMAEEVVQMQFVLPEYIDFKIGDTVSVYGTTYVLNQEPNFQKVSTINYAFELQFESFKYDLNKVLCLGLNSQNQLTETDYAIMGDPMMLLKHLVANANRLGGGWKVGFAEKMDPKNISFNNHNILSALSMCAEEFETEYWVDGDKTIHLIKKQAVSGLSLKYGMSQGLRTISRTTLDSSNVLTRLYAQGSTQNIPVKYRYGSARLKMDVPFLEKNIDKFGLIEFSKTFEDIYPKRNGKVTAVFENDPFRFVDSSQDFDLNGTTSIHGEVQPILLPGVSAKVTFNTGQLAGYTFEIKKHGYDHSKKSFVLLKNKDEKAYEVPNDLLKPAVGDQYVLTDIVMPEVYITNAETELKKNAQDYLNENSVPRLQYAVQSDPIYFENQNINLQLGNTIKFVDADFGLDADIRVVSITKDLQNPYVVEFSIAEEIQQQKIVRDYIEKNKKEQEIRESRKKFNESLQRNYEFSQEIQENVFDAEGYFDPANIKPLSIETKMLSVGSREQQFTLEDLTLMVEASNTALRNTKGQIVHYSLEDKPRTWNIPANTLNHISTGFNFIYIKAQKVGNNASVFVSPNQIKVDADSAFYHFEVGYLSSVSNGFRKIRLSNGFTNINGREITTGRITSQDGKTFIDLDTGEMRGKVTFTDDSPALDAIDQVIKEGIKDQEIYIEYSVNATSWHTPATSSDRFMRQKKGNGDWSVALPFGIDGKDGLQGPEGKQGIAGIKGTDGKTSYTHIAYADTATGGGFSQNPVDKTYIGMYVDFVAQDSTVPTKYKWSLIKGADGNQGTPGAKGADGKTPYFHTAWANNIIGTSGFSTTISVGKTHIGTYTDFIQTDSTDPSKYKWSQIKGDKGDKGVTGDRGLQGLQGPEGKQGIAGIKGTDGKTSYTHIAYADTATGGGFSQNPVDKTYIGMYVDFVAQDSTVPTKYKWSLIKGADGNQGTPGAKGADGKTPYFHTAWANNITGTSGFSTTISVGKTHIGTYTDFIQADSTNPSKYKWSQIKGIDGEDGESLGDGFIMYRDPTFKKGTNFLSTYVGAKPIRVLRPDDAPTDSTHIIRFNNTGEVGSGNKWAGGVQSTKSKANAVFIHKIVAKIPTGYKINQYNNSIGKGSKIVWLTSKEGTGRYETYMYKVVCGHIGSFGTFGYFAFVGSVVGTSDNPVIFDIAYATMLDMQKYDDTADNSLALSEMNKNDIVNLNTTTKKLETKTNYLSTTIDGNVVTTGTVQVGDANGNAKAGITGVKGSKANERVVIYAGDSFDNREKSPVQIWNNGLLVAKNANIEGHIVATSGKFTGHVDANTGNIGNFDITVNGIVNNKIQNYNGYGLQLGQVDNSATTVVNAGANNILGNYNISTAINRVGGRTIAVHAHAAGGDTNHALFISGGDISGMALHTVFKTNQGSYDIQNESIYINKVSVKRIYSVGLPMVYKWHGRTVTIMMVGNGYWDVYPGNSSLYLHEGYKCNPGQKLHFGHYAKRMTITYNQSDNTWYITSINEY